MADTTALKNRIRAAIKANDNQEITGPVLQQTLLDIVDELSDRIIDEYGFIGVAIPSTVPPSDLTEYSRVFYLTAQNGVYTNLGGVEVSNEIAVIKYNGSNWSKESCVSIDAVPTPSSDNLVKSGGVQNELALGAVYDVSARNEGATFASLSVLLNSENLNTLIPTAWRKGGMSIRFVQSSDNKYIQARCMAQNFTTDVTQWQGVDDNPKVGSNNIPESDGTEKHIIQKGVITLKVIDTGSIVSRLNDGEYGFNTSTNKIILKDSSAPNSYHIIDPSTNEGLFKFINTNNNIIYYKFNGTSLVQEFDVNRIINALQKTEQTLTLSEQSQVLANLNAKTTSQELVLERGSYTAVVEEVVVKNDNSKNTRLRSGLLKAPFFCEVNTGYAICNIIYLNDALEVIQDVQSDYTSKADVQTSDNYSYVLLVFKSNGSTLDSTKIIRTFYCGQEYVNNNNLGVLSFKRFSNPGYVKIDGTIVSDDTCCHTDYIEYGGGDIVVRGCSGNNAALLCFFDESKTTVLGYVNGTNKRNIIFTVTEADIPADTKYVIASGVAESNKSLISNLLYIKPVSKQQDKSYKESLALDYGLYNTQSSVTASKNYLYSGYLKHPLYIKTKSGYRVRSCVRYNDSFELLSTYTLSSSVVDVPENVPGYSVLNFEKEDGTAITTNNIIEEFYQFGEYKNRRKEIVGIRTKSGLNIGESCIDVSDNKLYTKYTNFVEIPSSIGDKVYLDGIQYTKVSSTEWLPDFTGFNQVQKIEKDNASYKYDSTNNKITQDSANASWFAKRFKVSAGDVIFVKGNSGSSVRLFALTDLNSNVLKIANGGTEYKTYVAIKAKQDGYVFINYSVDWGSIYINNYNEKPYKSSVIGGYKLYLNTENDNFVDSSADIDGVRFYRRYLMDTVIEKFDGLVSQYPTFITKTDAVTFANAKLAAADQLEYPEYTNGVTDYHAGDGRVDEYRTYVYTIKNPQNNLGYNDQNPRKKLFIFAGVHGSEITAQFNTFLFAKNILTNCITDANLFKLLSLSEIYIIPTVNGYGTCVGTRVNANQVNINRNYPTRLWHEFGIGTTDYSGPSAGSEFETQLLMAIIKGYNMDIVIDHHNYWGANHQLYFGAGDLITNNCIFRASVDISRKLLKEMPEYFGTNYWILTNDDSIIRGQFEEQGRMITWMNEYNSNIPAPCVEVSAVINFVGGVNQTAPGSENGTDVFKIAEFTLREIVYSLLQETLNY